MKTSVFVDNIDCSDYVESISSSCQFEEGYIIGNTPSTELSIKVDNSSGVFNALLDSQFVLKQDDKQLGVFNVIDKPERMTCELTLKLYDNMIKANIMYKSSLSYPCTVKDQLSEMKSILKLNINHLAIPTNLLNKQINFFDNTVSIRVHLSWIAEMCACNVFADENGNIKFVKLSKIVKHKITGDGVEKFDKIEEYHVTRVKLDNGLLSLEKGTEEFNTVYINPSNPYIELQAQIDYLHTELYDLTFWTMKDLKTVSISNLILGNMVEYIDNFNFMAFNIKTDYLNAAYDIQEISGELKTKSGEYVQNKNSNDVKIRGIKVVSDQNKAKLEIVSKEQDGLNEKVGDLSIDFKQIKSKVEQVEGSIYKFETGSGNIFDNCNQMISKKLGEDEEITLVTMPLGIDMNYMRNKDICISVDIRSSNAIPASLLGYMGVEFSVVYTDNTKVLYTVRFIPGYMNLELFCESGETTFNQRIFTHYKIANKAIKSVSNLKLIISCNGEKLSVANPKVEFGTKPTGFEYDLQEIRDNIVTLDKQFTTIDQKMDYLSLQSVSMTEEITTIKGNVTTITTRLNSTELKLTPTAITAMVNEKIGAGGSITTVSTVLDKNGFHINGAGWEVKNKAGTKVSYLDANGNLVINNLSASNGNFTGTINATSGTFKGTITASTISGGTITGTTINGGKINGVDITGGKIKVETDLYIGNTLYLGSQSSGETDYYRRLSFHQSAEILFSKPNLGYGQIVVKSSDIATLMAGDGTTGSAYSAAVSCVFGAVNLSAGGDVYITATRQISMNKTPTITSDIRRKNSLVDVDVNWIDKLNVLEFEYNGNADKQIGLIAQEYVDKEFSKYFLKKADDGFYGIQYGNITNALVKYCQSMRIDIANLNTEISQLKGRL